MNNITAAVTKKYATAIVDAQSDLNRRIAIIKLNITNGNAAFFNVGEELAYILDRGLYKSTGEFRSFRSWYNAQEFELTMEAAKRYIMASRTAERLNISKRDIQKVSVKNLLGLTSLSKSSPKTAKKLFEELVQAEEPTCVVLNKARHEVGLDPIFDCHDLLRGVNSKQMANIEKAIKIGMKSNKDFARKEAFHEFIRIFTSSSSR